MDTISLATRTFTCWMIVVSCVTYVIIHNEETNDNIVFFKFGPNRSLIILGICIDTYYKYISIISLCAINSMFRAIHTSYIQPWLINNVQDCNVPLHLTKMNVYEIVIVNTIYIWFDWCLYMNIILSQIDMLMAEIISDIVMTSIVTQYHLEQKNTYSQLNDTTYEV